MSKQRAFIKKMLPNYALYNHSHNRHKRRKVHSRTGGNKIIRAKLKREILKCLSEI